MKLKLSSLFLSLCLTILSSTLRADNKTVLESDAAAPISINKGDTISFSLRDKTPGVWNYYTLVTASQDPTSAPLVLDPEASYVDNSHTLTVCAFNVANSGQVVLVFTKFSNNDAVFPCEKTFTFIVNIQDPAVTPAAP